MGERLLAMEMTRRYCLNCNQYVNAGRDYRNIHGNRNLGTFVLGRMRKERCPKCNGTDFADVAPPRPEAPPTRETVIREVVLIPCGYCESLMPSIDILSPLRCKTQGLDEQKYA